MKTFDEYQEAAATTAIYPESHAVTYPVLGLCGEVGEVAEKVKKIIRDRGDQWQPDDFDAIGKELGDVLWYVAAICRDLDLSLGLVAQGNLDKLADRKRRAALQGSGDAR